MRIPSATGGTKEQRASPIHLTQRERMTAKFRLAPVRVEYNHGFASAELNTVAALVQVHKAELVKAWHEYFNVGN